MSDNIRTETDVQMLVAKALVDMKNDEDAGIQLLVVSEIELMDTLMKMFDDTPHISVKVAIINKMPAARWTDGPLDGLEWLIRVSRMSPDDPGLADVRMAAAKRLIVLRDEWKAARDAELGKLEKLVVRYNETKTPGVPSDLSETLQGDILAFLHSPFTLVREMVAASVESQDKLWEMREDVPQVRYWVASRIEDQDRLNYFENDTYGDVRLEVAKCTDSKDVLERLAKDTDERVAETASRRLAE